MPYVAGALSQLLLQSTWDCDLETLQNVQGQVFDLISMINCATAPTIEQLCGSMGTGGDDCMGCCLRYQNGKLQQLECGVWTDIAGQADGVPGAPPQPGQGSPQPAPQTCQEYTGVLQGNGKYLIPTPLSTGDTVQLETAIGATNDSIAWFCPDGSQFFSGECFDGLVTYLGTDPLPATPHLSVLLQVGADYYPLGQAGTVTVGAGHTNDQAILIVNTSTPATVNGSIQFKISVCNNQLGTFTHVFDFITNPWSAYVSIPTGAGSSGPSGVYSPGLGYINQLVTQGPANFTADVIDIAFPSTLITQITAEFGYGAGAYNGDTVDPTFYMQLDPGATVVNRVNMPTTPVSPQIWAGSQLMTRIEIGGNAGYALAPTDPGGTYRIFKVTVQGVGADPFV